MYFLFKDKNSLSYIPACPYSDKEMVPSTCHGLTSSSPVFLYQTLILCAHVRLAIDGNASAVHFTHRTLCFFQYY